MLGGMETLLGLIGVSLLAALPFAYAILQLRCLERWRGRWRLAAGLPLLAWALWGSNFIRDVTADPTSHNLFPLEIALIVLGASCYLAVVALLRWHRAPRVS